MCTTWKLVTFYIYIYFFSNLKTYSILHEKLTTLSLYLSSNTLSTSTENYPEIQIILIFLPFSNLQSKKFEETISQLWRATEREVLSPFFNLGFHLEWYDYLTGLVFWDWFTVIRIYKKVGCQNIKVHKIAIRSLLFPIISFFVNE